MKKQEKIEMLKRYKDILLYQKEKELERKQKIEMQQEELGFKKRIKKKV